MFKPKTRIFPEFDTSDEFWVNLSCHPTLIENRKRRSSFSLCGTMSMTASKSTPRVQRSFSDPAPVKELVPPVIMDEVWGRVRSDKPASSASCIIEMKWGSSAFLPAHRAGEKYKKVASEIEDILGRKGMGVADFISEDRGRAIFDRYSKRDRLLDGVVPSNVSYAAAGPSRLGAFEVHVVQGTWDPARCCPCKVDGGSQHGGPASHLPGYGVVCASCVARATVSPVAKDESSGGMSEQHTLMHSKLWTRRWPHMRQLLKDIACAVIPPPPPRGVDFQILPAPRSQFQPLSVIPLAAPGQIPPKKAYPEDRAVTMQKRLKALDCPAKAGWMVEAWGSDICRCGGGSHTLKLDGGGDSVAAILASLDFDKDHFMKWCVSNRGSWAGKDVNTFLQHYFQSDDEDMKEKLAQMKREFDQAITKIDADHQQVNDFHDKLVAKKASIEKEMEEACVQWKLAYEASVAEANSAFVAHCVMLVSELGDGAFRISCSSSVDDAVSAVKEVHAPNQQRWRAYQEWAQVAGAWSDVPEAFQFRPDLAGCDPKAVETIAREVQAASEQASAKISQTLANASRTPYEESLKASVATWQAAVQQFEQAKKEASQ